MHRKSRIKAQAGFTLVEVIVVAVIVAVLAGVSVPLYLGYVNSSRLNAASNAAGSAASFAGACVNSGKDFSLAAGEDITGNNPSPANELQCTDDGGEVVARLVVPRGIRLRNEGGNTIIGNHLEGAEDEDSDPYTFATAAAAPPPAAD